MLHEDRYGLPLSTASDAAASAYREGVDLMLAGWTGMAEALERAIAADPDFALPHIARARVHAFYQQGDLARQKAALARELAARRGTERERSHVETLALAIEGRLPEAIAATLKQSRAGRAMPWCCRCRSAPSACSPSPAWRTTIARGMSCARGSRGITARTGGFSPWPAGR